jgi:hypothetical protein
MENLNNLNKEQKEKLAKDINTPDDILAVLAKDEDWRIRAYVAQNEGTPHDILYELYHDDDHYIKTCVHCNSKWIPRYEYELEEYEQRIQDI